MKHATKCSSAPPEDGFGNLRSIRIAYYICDDIPVSPFLVGEYIFPNLILIFQHSASQKWQKIKNGKKGVALQKVLMSNS